jgi:multiple sugar transport system permease protein
MTSQLASARPAVAGEGAITAERPRRRRTRVRLSAVGVIRLLLLFGFAVFCLIPLVWLLFAPTKTNTEMVTANPLSFGSIQTALLAWQHLADYNGGVIYSWMANSVFYAVGSVVLSVAVAVPAAYALATMRFAGRKLILTLTLVAMVVPATAVVLPLFLELNAVHLTNTAASVILPAAFYPFGVYLAFVYFATSLPRELLEAARMDGCGELRVFLHTALPLAKPIIAILVFFSFVANWSNYFLPFVMLSDTSLYNLPVGLGNLISGSGALNPALGATDLPIHYPEAALAGLIVVVPVAILFIAFQRFLIRGLLSGSVKS